jgi:excinuclease ABC subunit A
MDKPDVDYISGLSPAISIDQKASSHNPRSTVGTVTEIHDYLRLLYAKIGIPHCPICKREITKLSIEEIVDRILEIGEGKEVEILSPVVRDRKGEYSALLLEMFRRGFSSAWVNEKKYELTPKTKIPLERYKRHKIDIVVDSVIISDVNISRIFEDVEKALKLSDGLVKIKSYESKINNCKKEEFIYNQKLACPEHDFTFPDLEPRLFSFNSPYGACPECEGLGTKKEIDPDLVAPDKNKTISEGGLMPWSYKKNNWQGTVLRSVTNFYHIPDNVRLRDLSKKHLDILLFGDEDPDDIPVTLRSKTGSVWKYNISWKGVTGYLSDRYKKTDSDSVRRDIEKYMSQSPCSACGGSRYKSEILLVTVGEKNIDEISGISIKNVLDFFNKLKFSKKEEAIAGRIIREVRSRLGFLVNVGLDYLTLGRNAQTLAGGETQRIRLASQVGSQLVGVLYVLDEPSIGLHARDNSKLLETLLDLRNIGNTLIVIEHDEETMRAADYLVDIGPGAGKFGGKIVAEGNPKEVIKNKKSLTAKYLSGDQKIDVPAFRRPTKNKKTVVVRGARENNLKGINVEFPLKVFTCVTGVSGSGKSTLVEDILYKSLSHNLMRSLERPGKHQEIVGTHNLDKVILIDQSPIGRTPRSNPATYTGLFTPIRELFSQTKDSKAKGYLPGRFSFNVSGGRCDIAVFLCVCF